MFKHCRQDECSMGRTREASEESSGGEGDREAKGCRVRGELMAVED